MAKTKEDKEGVIADLREQLKDAHLTVVFDYQGVTVDEIADLRKRLRPVGGTCRIAKNTLVRIAVKEDFEWQPMQEFLKGPSALMLIKDDLRAGIQAYKVFQKEKKKTELRGGVMEGRALTKEQVEELAYLPSKNELMAQIAGSISAIIARVASSIQAVKASQIEQDNTLTIGSNEAAKSRRLLREPYFDNLSAIPSEYQYTISQTKEPSNLTSIPIEQDEELLPSIENRVVDRAKASKII